MQLALSEPLPGSGLSISLFNEANASALAQQLIAPPDCSDFLFVSGEVGIGGGVIIDSELLVGPHGHAGELGHVLVQPQGDHCSCGIRGCLETVAGQASSLSSAGICGDEQGPKDLSRVERLTALHPAVESDDQQAMLAVSLAGEMLGIAVASAIRLLDIATVILGGHFVALKQWLLPAFKERLDTYAPQAFRKTGISFSVLGQTGALVGAGYSVVRSLIEASHRLG